jgi:hypothetical protein
MMMMMMMMLRFLLPLLAVIAHLSDTTEAAFLVVSPSTTSSTIIAPTTSSSSFRPSSLPIAEHRRCQRFLALQAEESSDGTSSSSSSSSRSGGSSSSIPDLRGKTLYQRAFYRFTPTTTIYPPGDASIYNAMVIEERLRFQVNDKDPTTVLPFGPRTLILRNGQVEDGKIGKEFCSINVQEELHTRTHRSGLLMGKKPDGSWISTLGTALYIAAHPTTLGQGRVLQLACDLGLAALLGCIGASFVLQQQDKKVNIKSGNDSDGDDMDDLDDILTISRDKDQLLSNKLKLLALTDIFPEDGKSMELVLLNLEHAVGPHGAHQVVVKSLDWTSKQQQQQQSRSSRNNNKKPFTTIIASDVATTFLYAKALANTVAHALAPSAPYYFAQNQQQQQRSSQPSKIKLRIGDMANDDNGDDDDIDDVESRILPRFVHIAPENRGDEVSYLHRFLQQGYNMQVDVAFLKVERIVFALQTVDTSDGKALSSPAAEEAMLDEHELEVAEIQEFVLESITATHDARYAGGGSGEIFFPMETGEYDQKQQQNSGIGGSGAPYMEREWDRK